MKILDMPQYYSGIGSRETPLSIGVLMAKIAYKLAKLNYTLRSGGAHGADQFFEYGCDAGQGKKEIYRPQREDNGNNIFRNITEVKQSLVVDNINYDNLKTYTQLLFRRNINQVLGDSLENAYLKSKFCIFWIKTSDIYRKYAGGTRIAVRCADRYNIPLFNLLNSDIHARFTNFIKDVKWEPDIKEFKKLTKISGQMTIL